MKPGNGHVSVAVRIDGELRSTPTDLAPDSLFPIYSITKTLAAICVLRAAESGAIAIDASARQWLPEVEIPAAITPAQLLCHTSGLRDYGPMPAYHQAVRDHPGNPWTREHFLDAVLSQGPLFPPGQGWAYSNIGYALLIDILERATGRTFRQLLSDFIAVPLGLPQMRLLEQIDDLMACVPGFGSEVSGNQEVVDVRGRYHPGWCAPRVVASTPAEITRAFDALLAGDLLQPATLARMLTLVPLPGPFESGRMIAGGMGVYSDLESALRYYHHGGGGPGYDLAATVYPDTPLGRVSVAVFVTSSGGPRATEREPAIVEQLLNGG